MHKHSEKVKMGIKCWQGTGSGVRDFRPLSDIGSFLSCFHFHA